MDKVIESRLQEIVELYDIVKEQILYAEEVDPNQKTNIQLISELRHSFDHLMRVFAAKYKIENEGDEEYIKINLNKCFAHVYRVGYDTLDWLSLNIKLSIMSELSGFSNEAITAVLPTYYTEMRPEMEETIEKFSKLRATKDVGDKNVGNFIEYVNSIKKIRKYQIDIIKGDWVKNVPNHV